MKLKKNNVKRRRFAIILALLLFYPSIVYAEVIPEHTKQFYVNDFADIISDSEEEAMVQSSDLLNYNKKDVIYVVTTTVENIEKDTVEDYATNMYKLYGIGKDKHGFGTLILFVKNSKTLYIKSENDDKTFEYIVEKYKQKELDGQGLANLHREIVIQIEKQHNYLEQDYKKNTMEYVIMLLLCGLIIFSFYVAYMASKKEK